MQNILIIINAPPYGSERCLSALRLATALAGNDAKPAIRIFLMSDATVLGLPNQIDGAGNGLQGMVEQLVGQGVDIRLCRTCALARGLGDLPLIPGTAIGTLVELAEATLLADKVITFWCAVVQFAAPLANFESFPPLSKHRSGSDEKWPGMTAPGRTSPCLGKVLTLRHFVQLKDEPDKMSQQIKNPQTDDFILFNELSKVVRSLQ